MKDFQEKLNWGSALLVGGSQKLISGWRLGPKSNAQTRNHIIVFCCRLNLSGLDKFKAFHARKNLLARNRLAVSHDACNFNLYSCRSGQAASRQQVEMSVQRTFK
jgi:hypothetical protein